MDWGGSRVRLPFSLGVDISTAAAGDMGPSGGANPRRDAWFRQLGVNPDRTFLHQQVHSRTVVVVGSGSVCVGEPADGAVTADPGVALAVTVADCMPIFVHDRENGVFAALHSGWKGTGIVLRALDLMQQRWGSRAESVSVLLGPCIGPCCYPVDEERAAAFVSEWGNRAVVRDRENRPRLDLRRANVEMLESRGVRDITLITDCTGCTGELGSYRRQGPASFVRMIAVIRGPRQ